LYLSTLKVENYRAVRSAELDFDNTTVLIGENDCGKSSLLDALARVLDDDTEDGGLTFEAREFHHEKGKDTASGPIRIRLGFEERRPGEWSDKAYQPIAELLPEISRKPRKLYLDLQADAVNEGSSQATWQLESPGSHRKTSDSAVFQWLRQMAPIIRITGGMLTGHEINHEPDTETSPSKTAPSPEIAQLIQRILESTSALLSRNTSSMSAELDNGFAAARELMETRDNYIDWGMLALDKAIGEILGKDLKDLQSSSIALNESGSYAEKLGFLLLVAALLREHPEGFLPHAEPIWIIEDPEAHLHPMTLASLALMLGHIDWQKIVTTHSGDFLAAVPLKRIRRLTRYNGIVHQYRVREHALSLEDLRRLGYHQRTRNSVASFSRLWLLVEGESEFWVVPQIARLMGYEFALEGISCIEFAQCGLDPLIKAARELGIEWHLLADGDDAGQHYLETGREFLGDREESDHITLLCDLDIEHCFWENGYSGVYEHHSRLSPAALRNSSPAQVIRQAVKKRSKPYLALSVVEAVSEDDSPGIPVVMNKLVETCVRLAREAPARHAMNGDEHSTRQPDQKKQGDPL
jgi:putative ATP-dependent endonuclease of OLD family